MSRIKRHYDDYYTGGDSDRLRIWRDVCARGKAGNVKDRWGAVQPEGPPRRILEIGCGEGALLHALSGFASEAVGIDISRSGIEAARARRVPNATFEVNDGPIPYPEGAFDLAILSHVVEHVEDPRSLIREASRVARYVFIEVPLELHWGTPEHFQWTDLGHINLYNPLLIRHLVESCDLRVLDEAVTSVDLPVARFSGCFGVVKWAVKRAMLRLSPSVAIRLATFHGSLVAGPV